MPGHPPEVEAEDVTSFLNGFRKQPDGRGLKPSGVTTDGSSLYPGPLALVFNGVPHPVCGFHVVKELTGAVLHAPAEVRKEMTAKPPRPPRGRTRSCTAPAGPDASPNRLPARNGGRVCNAAKVSVSESESRNELAFWDASQSFAPSPCPAHCHPLRARFSARSNRRRLRSSGR